MINLVKLVKAKKHVMFSVAENRTKLFLAWVKENGFRWINGQKINPEKDRCGFFMGLSDNMTIGYVAPMIYIKYTEDVLKIRFE